jgi:large subunit ribosomal protein L22
VSKENLGTTAAIVAKAQLRGYRATPQKSRRVVDLVRGQRADLALNMMRFANQPELGKAIYDLIASAVANAKQSNPNLRDASELWVVEALVDEGFTMKRFRARAQGRGFPINKRSSQITITLSDDRKYRTNLNLKAGKKKIVAKTKADDDLPEKKSDSQASVKTSAPKAAAKKATAKKASAKKATTKKAAGKEVNKEVTKEGEAK